VKKSSLGVIFRKFSLHVAALQKYDFRSAPAYIDRRTKKPKMGSNQSSVPGKGSLMFVKESCSSKEGFWAAPSKP